MDITQLLAFSVKNNASDLHLSGGMPPMIRVDGEMSKINLPVLDHNQVQAVVYPLEMQAGVTEYWMGLQNFYTITRYNKSTLYATAVAQLANNIKLRWAMQEAYSGL